MSDPNDKFYEAPKEFQRECIERLWEVVNQFCNSPNVSDEELFRLKQVRFKVAIVARTSGIMDLDTFQDEASAFTALIAGAMGGIAMPLGDAAND
jgi:hypothetical protein